jgi:hypothetical protein
MPMSPFEPMSLLNLTQTRVIHAVLVATLRMVPVLDERAYAHHGIGRYDPREHVELEGTLTRLDFVNPHSYVYFEVVGEDGRVIAMRCEMRAATVLRRSGWSPDMFKPGVSITVTGNPHRDDPTACTVDTLTLGDAPTLKRYQQLRTRDPSIARNDPSGCRRASRTSPATGRRSNRSWQGRPAGAPGSYRSARLPRSRPANCRCRTDPPAGSRRP